MAMIISSDRNNGYPRVDTLPELSSITLPSVPYPSGLLRINPLMNDGYPYSPLMPDVPMKGPGAFCHAERLTRVSIPESVKKIGKEAFRYTALRKVRIASDCEYYPTSFPVGCDITYYGGGGEYGQLYDSEGYAIIDRDGARIYVKE